MALDVQGCCEKDIHSLGVGCSLEAIAFTNIFAIERYRDGYQAGLPSVDGANTIGEEIRAMVAQTATLHNNLYPFPRPTQITFAPSDETTSTDPVGYEQVNGGGNIYMATVSFIGDNATTQLERNIKALFGCKDIDVVFGDDNGAIVGLKKLGLDGLLYGWQVQKSTVKIKFERAVKGSDVNKLTLSFQVLKVSVTSQWTSLIPADVLGYSAEDLMPLRYFTGRLSAVSSTSLSVQFIGDSSDATKKLYLQGFTGTSPQVLTLVNLTANTSTVIPDTDITEVVVDDSLVTNNIGTSYTVTITAATTGDQLKLIATGVDGYEAIVSNIVDAL